MPIIDIFRSRETTDCELTYETDAVLQREIKLVAPLHHLITLLLSLPPALQRPAGSVDINLDVFLEGLDQTFSVTLGVTV